MCWRATQCHLCYLLQQETFLSWEVLNAWLQAPSLPQPDWRLVPALDSQSWRHQLIGREEQSGWLLPPWLPGAGSGGLAAEPHLCAVDV